MLSARSGSLLEMREKLVTLANVVVEMQISDTNQGMFLFKLVLCGIKIRSVRTGSLTQVDSGRANVDKII